MKYKNLDKFVKDKFYLMYYYLYIVLITKIHSIA